MMRKALLFFLPVLCLGNIFPEDIAIKMVLERYNKLAYPGTEKNPTVVVNHALSLIRLVEVTKKRVVVDVWEQIGWVDPRLTWIGQSESIRLPVSEIWTPDITLYNSGIVSSKNQNENKALIQRDGNVLLVVQKRLDVNGCISSSDDVTECSFKFGSWTYDGNLIDLENMPKDTFLSDYQIDPDFEITSSSSARNVKYYSCCPEPYTDITYNFTLTPTKG